MKHLNDYIKENFTLGGGVATLMPNTGVDTIQPVQQISNAPIPNAATPASTTGMGSDSDIGMLNIKKHKKRKLKKHNEKNIK